MWGRPLYFPDGEELCFLLTLYRAEHVNDTLFRAVVSPSQSQEHLPVQQPFLQLLPLSSPRRCARCGSAGLDGDVSKYLCVLLAMQHAQHFSPKSSLSLQPLGMAAVTILIL